MRPPIKIHGGKHYLYKWIISNFPSGYESMKYVEPYFGGGNVLLNKRPSVIEVVNDLNYNSISVFLALRDKTVSFISGLQELPYDKEIFNYAKTQYKKYDVSSLHYAMCQYTINRMSRNGMGEDFSWSDRERGGQPEAVNAWKTMLSQLPAIAERLQPVAILNQPAVEIIERFDGENTLFYLDPPYYHSTRTATDVYDFEMTREDHIELLELIKGIKGKVLLSGYYSELYNQMLVGWRTATKDIVNNASQSKTKSRRTEWLWMNY